MGFLSLALALLLEQWRPLSHQRPLFELAERYSGFFERQFNAGETEHGVIAWMCAVLPAFLGTWLVYAMLAHVSGLLALAFNVVVLYLTLGFRQFSHYFTDIQLALKDGDLAGARALLASWRGHSCSDLGEEEIVRLTIEEALAASHRHVFGVAFWFMLLPGPSGAVLYRLSFFLRRRWVTGSPVELEAFARFPAQVFAALDWLPARFTAASFAVVGDFEDAIFCWRSQAEQWREAGRDSTLGVVIAAGAGALGVRLGNPYVCEGVVVERPELGLGEIAEPGFLDSTVGLVWRALVLWLAMVLLISVVHALA
jgi:adenosylcobinamide-phosphate synthase